MVSGHGTSPNCREVIYRFKSRDNKSHTVKLLEYYQFGRVVDDKVEVLTKEYFLEFDGINWEDKKALAENGILHIAREYFDVRDEVELVEYKEVNPRSIEGLLLHDGVFIGGISNFSLGNNPVVIFNTCASMVELGNLVSFAGARCLLGTMWSVYDKSARQFAKRLFQLLPTHSLADSFFQARQSIRDNYSKLAYVNFGTLNSYLPIQKHIEDQEEALKYMADRLTSSLSEATHHFVNGYLSKLDFKTLIYMQSVSEKFVNINLPTDIDLRKRLKYIANKLDSKKSIDNSNDFRLD